MHNLRGDDVIEIKKKTFRNSELALFLRYIKYKCINNEDIYDIQLHSYYELVIFK